MPPKNTKNGAFILSRSLFESKVFENKPSWWFKVWIYIIGHVNYSDTEIHVKGEGFFTLKRIFDDCNLFLDGLTEVKTISNVVRWLKKEEQIQTRRSSRGFIVKVLNYEKYQTLENYTNHHKRPNANDAEMTQKRNRNEKRTTQKRQANDTIKEEKEKRIIKRKREKEPLSPKCYELAQKFFDYIGERYLELQPQFVGKNPEETTQKMQALYELWANEFRKLQEIDGLNVKQIEYLIDWLYGTDYEEAQFWRQQIFSPSKLRKKNNDGIIYWRLLVDKIKYQNEKERKNSVFAKEYSL